MGVGVGVDADGGWLDRWIDETGWFVPNHPPAAANAHPLPPTPSNKQQDSLSLSALESALLDTPSLYLGRSSLAPGGGGFPGFGAGSHLGGALSSSAILGGTAG